MITLSQRSRATTTWGFARAYVLPRRRGTRGDGYRRFTTRAFLSCRLRRSTDSSRPGRLQLPMSITVMVLERALVT
jgi:hypothetical protein